jgi:hypothetical protein
LSPDQGNLETERLGEVDRRIGEGLRQGFETCDREELLAVVAQRHGSRVVVEQCALRSGTGDPPARVNAERSVLRGATGGPPARVNAERSVLRGATGGPPARVNAERSVLRGATGGSPARVNAERSVLRGATGGPPDQRTPRGERWKPKGEDTPWFL